MNNDRFAVLDGRVVELGPEVIPVEAADLELWKEAGAQLQKTENALAMQKLRLISIVAAATIGPLLLSLAAMIVISVFNLAWERVPGADFVQSVDPKHVEVGMYIYVLIVLAISSLISRIFIKPKKKMAEKDFEQKRRAILAKYGDYKLEDVTTLDNWWRTAKYALIAKEEAN